MTWIEDQMQNQDSQLKYGLLGKVSETVHHFELASQLQEFK